jgi:hypothetical protein
VVVLRVHPGEVLVHLRPVGQAHHRAVEPEQAMAAPASDAFGRGVGVNRRQDAVPVEGDEHRVLELGAGVGPRAGGHRRAQLTRRQPVEELVQVALERLGGLLQDEEHRARKGQEALAAEVRRPLALGGDQLTGLQTPAQGFHEFDHMGGDGCDHTQYVS